MNIETPIPTADVVNVKLKFALRMLLLLHRPRRQVTSRRTQVASALKHNKPQSYLRTAQKVSVFNILINKSPPSPPVKGPQTVNGYVLGEHVSDARTADIAKCIRPRLLNKNATILNAQIVVTKKQGAFFIFSAHSRTICILIPISFISKK